MLLERIFLERRYELKDSIVVTNIIWRFAERCGAQIVSLIVSIILARILSPSDYGTVAILTVFITILNVFVNCGLSSALVQKKNPDNIDYSTVFIFNIIACIVLYIFLWILSPLIAMYYHNERLCSMTRVIGITIIIGGIKNVQQAYVSKTMQFKKFFYATFVGTVISAFIGITMAYNGYGPWALIFQSLSNTAIDTLMLWITVHWRPSFVFSRERFRDLFVFGWNIFLFSIFNTIYNNLRQLIIGNEYSSEDLAFYNKGKSWPYMIIQNVNDSIDSVLFPTLSDSQDDFQRMGHMMKRSIGMSTYILMPCFIGLCAVSTPLTSILLTDKWLPSVPFLCIVSITYMFYPIHTTNLNAIKALGKSKLFLKLEIVKKVLGILIIAAIVIKKLDVIYLVGSLLITEVIDIVVDTSVSKKYFNYGLKSQLVDITPSLVISLIMGLTVYLIQYIVKSNLPCLIIQILLGISIFTILSLITKNENFRFLLTFLKNQYTKRRISHE